MKAADTASVVSRLECPAGTSAPALPRFRRVLAAGAVLVAALVPSATARGAGPYSFPHRPHLSDATVEAGLRAASATAAGSPARGGGGTVDAECRVCHDFKKGVEAHLSGCATCHVGDAYLELDVAPAAARARRTFPHAKHLEKGDLTCFSCHRMRVEMDWVEFSVSPPSLGPRGVAGRPGGPLGEATCADCHATHEPVGGKVTLDEKSPDGKACATCHMAATAIVPRAYRAGRGEPGAVRPFRHGDHGGAAATCESCHSEMRASTSIWDADPTGSTAERCATCHIADAAGTPLVGVGATPRTSRVPFTAFSKFPHASHLAAPKGEIQVSGKVTAGCATCHFPETDPDASRLFPGRAPSAEPVGRAALVDYRACEPCHAAWRVLNHGVGAWACFKCHSGRPDADGKLPVARVQVERQDLTQVAFATVHHPGITSGAAELADPQEPDGRSCGDCHVGDLAVLRSRLAGRAFAHAPHVSDDTRNADCLACHPSAATTSWSQDLRRFEARVGGAGSVVDGAAHARGCLECHVGATQDQLGLAQVVREVPQFDHKSHVTSESYYAGLSGIECTECHVKGGDSGYQVPEDVANCTRCHAHDEAQTDKYARTGPKSSEGETQACKWCHDDLVVAGAAPRPRETVRTHLDLLPGRQWHDKGGDCAACHERDALAGAAGDYGERVRTARVKASIHDDPALAGEWFNRPEIKDPGHDPQGRTCMTCHRREPRGYLRSLGR